MYLQSFNIGHVAASLDMTSGCALRSWTPKNVNAFLLVLDGMMGGGLVTLERAKVIRYQDQGKDKQSSGNLAMMLVTAKSSTERAMRR